MRNKISNTYELLRAIIENKESELDTQTLIKKYLNGVKLIEAYSFIEELKNEGYITILPITGMVGSDTNVRQFYNRINHFDFMEDVNRTNIVNVTTKGYDYYSAKESEKWRFRIPLIISGIATIISVVGTVFSIVSMLKQ